VETGYCNLVILGSDVMGDWGNGNWMLLGEFLWLEEVITSDKLALCVTLFQ
jgi:hypothetical protein